MNSVAASAEPEDCPTCRGNGEIAKARVSPFHLRTIMTCPSCNGVGKDDINDPDLLFQGARSN